MEPLHLTDRAVLAVTGPEAREFLQGLVTNDIGAIRPGIGLYSALLSPQGKILFDFFIAEGDGALLIDCAAEAQEALFKKLRLYRLRAKVELEMRDQLGVYVALPADAAARAVSFADPRLAAMPARSIGAIAEMPAGLPGPAAYHAARLALGVPEAADFGTEKIFALDGGLDELHGVSFTKGCYVGQELTARMKHRATARKRPWLVTADTPLPDIGTAIVINGTETGEIIARYGREGFALVRLDRLTDARGEASAQNIPVALARPSWLA
jgi:folate-binding protein YgfZ